MESLLKKYRKKPVSIFENEDSGFIATNKYYLLVQDRWAKRMEASTTRLSKRKLVCSLVLFVVLAGGACIYCISKSFSNTAMDNNIKIVPLSKPIDVIGRSFVLNPKSFSISHGEFERISRFRMYLDSLGRSPIGKRTFDSIARLRPGLIDSLAFIENYYKSNCKNLRHGTKNSII